MSTREAALETALREARSKMAGAVERDDIALLAHIDAALSLPPDDLPARMAEGLREASGVLRDLIDDPVMDLRLRALLTEYEGRDDR